jgi:hypothetical protein
VTLKPLRPFGLESGAALRPGRGVWLTLLLSMFPCMAFAINPWAGVWRGTLGERKIAVCFNQSEFGDYDGNYYFEGQGKPISLKREARDKTWRELSSRLGDTGFWTLDKPSGSSASGQWRKPGQKDSVPLHLTRILDGTLNKGKGQRECASDAYNATLETAPQLVVGKTKTLDGRHYRGQSVTVPGADGDALRIEGVELLEAGAHIAAVNRELLRSVPRTKVDLQRTLYWCRRNTLGRVAEDGSQFMGVDLAYWSRRYVSVTSVSNESCGGARPTSYNYYRTWDLGSGNEVNLWTWIRNSRKPTAQAKNDNYHFNYAASDKLNAVIVAYPAKGLRAIADAACTAQIAANREYKMRLGKKGMVFSTSLPEGRRACEATFVVPYWALLPYLSKPGEAAVKAIMRDTPH